MSSDESIYQQLIYDLAFKEDLYFNWHTFTFLLSYLLIYNAIGWLLCINNKSLSTVTHPRCAVYFTAFYRNNFSSMNTQ